MFSVLNVISVRNTVLGLVSWLVPSIVSFMFFDRTGQLMIAQPLFKSIMVVVGGGTGAVLLVAALKQTPPSLRTGFSLGCYWFLLNLGLDLLALVWLMKMPLGLYAIDIGLRYVLMPIMGASMGVLGSRTASVDGRD